jgi:hypothetical protein
MTALAALGLSAAAAGAPPPDLSPWSVFSSTLMPRATQRYYWRTPPVLHVAAPRGMAFIVSWSWQGRLVKTVRTTARKAEHTFIPPVANATGPRLGEWTAVVHAPALGLVQSHHFTLH